MGVQAPFFLWFERSGGFTGISTKVEIDSKSLTQEETEKLKRLIDQTGFLGEQHKHGSTPAALPDQFQYQITIAYGNQRHTVTLHEPNVPESFRPLINYLTQKARLQKNQ